LYECFGFFATSTKDKWVATFESHNMLMVAAKIYQQLVNENLCMAATCAFADIDALGMCGYQRHDLIGNQAVMDNDLCARD
jgi:hypothetical protein